MHGFNIRKRTIPADAVLHRGVPLTPDGFMYLSPRNPRPGSVTNNAGVPRLPDSRASVP